MHSFQLLGLAAVGSVVSAAPTASRVSDLVKKSSSTCTFTSASEASESIASCSNVVLSNIEVSAGETLDLSDAADGTTITFEGTTSFGYEEWDGPLIRFGGKQLTITQADGAVIDGDGSRWWDSKGTNGGKTKPKFMYIHDVEDSTIKGLQIKNTPVQAISVQATNTYLTDITIDNSAGDDNGGHNTDGFDISESDGVYISGATVKNQDDCIAINSGENILFTGGTCSGGHGLSIGSVGGRDDNTVKNVTISDSTISNSANGVRIKTIYDATGDVSEITYSNIQLSGITDYGIVIEQDYENGSPTGTPSTGVPITDVTVDGVTGSVEDDAVQVYILCGDGSCSGWTWSGVDITGGKSSSDCENVPSGASC
ncbi:glycoside hydrolase family 28 protein [Aspergillus saccharolyticus JOP 1030-1]|uniref:endo-polygalacturonase n=1 Tax=Aspergillus saccharolyticus JOP 1030-1 TaxID=1450539 RepID=A0A318ZQG8_9EURO|nr:putative endopolygalacturonase II [Aspergillus saccharolyticus JOP 1030-1]PYH49746.1 putative endopolygalacturonase II [Aspergillus saccharolyticus JOP 1030-1]